MSATPEARSWDGRAEVDLALFIRRYLAEHPPPAGARVAADLEAWAERLDTDGRVRLEAAGARRLSSLDECPS